MLVLFRFFVELCLLRRAPQDLPASEALLVLVLVADLAVGMLLGVRIGLSPAVALGEGLAELLLTLALLLLALTAFDRAQRFRQTATALLGSEAMLGLAAMPLLAIARFGGQDGVSALVGLLFLAFVGWSILVTGHILRHAFDLRFGQGVAVAVLYNLVAYWLISTVFSGS